jgi:hypothetical protein
MLTVKRIRSREKGGHLEVRLRGPQEARTPIVITEPLRVEGGHVQR